jgi:methylmalonyl-CoA/ethylmalonyl-CoA epimerase
VPFDPRRITGPVKGLPDAGHIIGRNAGVLECCCNYKPLRFAWEIQLDRGSQIPELSGRGYSVVDYTPDFITTNTKLFPICPEVFAPYRPHFCGRYWFAKPPVFVQVKPFFCHFPCPAFRLILFGLPDRIYEKHKHHMENNNNQVAVKELRIILTVENLDEVIAFYRDVVGLQTSKEWDEATGSGIILEAGRASLELVDKNHAAHIDAIEVGKRVAGPVRLALNVGQNIEGASRHLLRGGAAKVAEIKQAPWSKVMRMQDPAGMQFTLFENSTLFDK